MWFKKNSELRLLQNEVLMDVEWYSDYYHVPIRKVYKDYLCHFMERDPSLLFSTQSYWKANLDIKAKGINPLIHYIKHGRKEKRNLFVPDKDYEIISHSCWFHPRWYRDMYMDGFDEEIDPAWHYLKKGWREGNFPSSNWAREKESLSVYSDGKHAPLLNWYRSVQEKKLPRVCILGEHGYGDWFGVAYIRLFQPFLELERRQYIFLKMIRDIDITTGENDLYVLQRGWKPEATLEEAKILVSKIKKENARIVYDIDDNLLESENVSITQKEIIKLFAQAADMITVSTQPLQVIMKKYNEHVCIVPNFLDISLFEKVKEQSTYKSDQIIVAYFGTFTHQQDLNMILDALQEIFHRYPQTKLKIIGAKDPQKTLPLIPNIEYIDPTPFANYLDFCNWMSKNAHWDIGIAPLSETAINYCKSDIKFLDYAAVHTCGIFSDTPAYRISVKNKENGLLVKNDKLHWIEALEFLILNTHERRRYQENAHSYLKQYRTIQGSGYIQWENIVNNILTQEMKGRKKSEFEK